MRAATLLPTWGGFSLGCRVAERDGFGVSEGCSAVFQDAVHVEVDSRNRPTLKNSATYVATVVLLPGGDNVGRDVQFLR